MSESTTREATSPAGERIDRALLRDTTAALRRWPAWLFLAAWLVGIWLQVSGGGMGRLSLILIIAGGCVAYGVIAWFAGRDIRADPTPLPVRAPAGEALAIGAAQLGVILFVFGYVLPPLALPGAFLFIFGVLAWAVTAARAGYRLRDFAWLRRSWRPFAMLMLAVAVPKLLALGLPNPIALAAAVPSGIAQQVVVQAGLQSRFEAVTRRADLAAVLTAVGFGITHTPLNLPLAGGDFWLALGAGLVFQAPIGLVFCIGYVRHRAPLPLGMVHAIAIT